MNLIFIIFDKLDKFWESKSNGRIVGNIMIVVFILSLIIIQFNRWNLTPDFVLRTFGKNHFFAIEIVFTLLLVFEIISLIIHLSKSVAISMAKQFEIFSLILLRKAFKEIGHLDEPIIWDQAIPALSNALLDTLSAILIFAGIVLFKNIAKHRPITEDKSLQIEFSNIKKIISLGLLLFFTALGIYDIAMLSFYSEKHDFFNSFYTALIFSDILIVVVSLKYSHKYLMLFRNSGFAIATVFLRLALSAPIYYNMFLGISAMLIVLSLSYIYNRFDQVEKFER